MQSLRQSAHVSTVSSDLYRAIKMPDVIGCTAPKATGFWRWGKCFCQRAEDFVANKSRVVWVLAIYIGPRVQNKNEQTKKNKQKKSKQKWAIPKHTTASYEKPRQKYKEQKHTPHQTQELNPKTDKTKTTTNNVKNQQQNQIRISIDTKPKT